MAGQVFDRHRLEAPVDDGLVDSALSDLPVRIVWWRFGGMGLDDGSGGPRGSQPSDHAAAIDVVSVRHGMNSTYANKARKQICDQVSNLDMSANSSLTG
jgi:hypothetical protein